MDRPGFIERHGLWSDDQARLGAELRQRVAKDDLSLIRLAWADPHGATRAKVVTVPTFVDALTEGYNINVATSTLDASGGRVFTSFVRGGGMGLDEMTGSPNLIIVPDPGTFRTLPWAPGVGWVQCDEYFVDGRPFHFSTRRLLRRQLERLAERGMRHVVGLEVEWYLARVVQDDLTPENIGSPGQRGRPIETVPVEPGYMYHSESNVDLMQPMLSELAEVYDTLGLGLRSMENEFGPGQVECTFVAGDASRVADDFVLFRSATRQVCRRHGYLASFMCFPAFPGYYSSGWHLHQSIADAATGENLVAPTEAEQPLSEMGQAFLAGLLEHAVAATIFSTPTVNGYRRFRPNSLAPDRVSWGGDHRGTLMRVLGGVGDKASRIENRGGESAANPYLFIASQIAAGLDGIARGLELGPADDDPYNAPRPMLPKSLAEGIAAMDASEHFRRDFGDLFVDYYRQLKQAELDRYHQYCDDNAIDRAGADITEWEQNEYWDFF